MSVLGRIHLTNMLETKLPNYFNLCDLSTSTIPLVMHYDLGLRLAV